MRRQEDPTASGFDPEGAVLAGRLLRTRRESRNLTPEQVGLALRVAVRHVLAVEEGRFGDLPPRPYARGLVSSYAALVGLDPEPILRSCGPALSGEASRQPTRIFHYPLRDEFVWREWAAPFALAAVVAVIVIARAVLTPAPLDLEAPAPVPVAQPVLQLEALADAAPPAGLTPDEPVEDQGLRLTLQCEGTTWAEAAADGGPPQRYELGPGQNLTIAAREKLSLSLGDAGVLRLKVNGRELGFIGDKGEVKLGLSFTAAPPPAAASPRAAGD